MCIERPADALVLDDRLLCLNEAPRVVRDLIVCGEPVYELDLSHSSVASPCEFYASRNESVEMLALKTRLFRLCAFLREEPLGRAPG